MEHKTFVDIQRVARVAPIRSTGLSRRERLERWAAILEQDPQRRLTPLQRLEFLPAEKRAVARADDSPLSLAFGDPVLREQGLTGDRLSDAVEFFGLSDQYAHYLLCDCYYQGSMTAGRVASRIRSLARRAAFGTWWSRMRETSLAWLGLRPALN